MIMFLGIDPGQSTGVAMYDENANLIKIETLHIDVVTNFLNRLRDIHVAVVEDYKVYPQKAQQHVYSDLATPRVIGRIEAWAELHNVKLVKQGAHLKNIGYKYLGKKPYPKSNKLNHAMDAHAHFTYWAVGNNIIKPEALL